jgi:hypothetical protein
LAVDTGRFLVTVPKAAMNKNDFPAGAKDEIGSSWEIAPMKPVSVAETVDQRSDRHLRLHIFALNSTHILGAPLARKSVSHGQSILPC